MSSQEHRNNYSEEAISEKSVEEYLRTHPDFFLHNPLLLTQLKVPHNCGAAVSLIEHQVTTLRDQNRQLKDKLMDLVNVARDNDRLNERMLRLILALMETKSLDDVLITLEENLLGEFQADAVAIRLFDPNNEISKTHHDKVMTETNDTLLLFENFFKSNRPLCGRLKQQQLEYLFNTQGSKISSAALVPLGRKSNLGILAIGSFEHERFHPGMGTVFLKQMSTLITSILQRHLPV